MKNRYPLDIQLANLPVSDGKDFNSYFLIIVPNSITQRYCAGYLWDRKKHQYLYKV